MTAQQSRIIPPEEARALADAATPGPWVHRVATDQGGGIVSLVGSKTTWQAVADARGLQPGVADLIAAAPDLAHTAAVLGEQREAVLALLADPTVPHWDRILRALQVLGAPDA